MARRNPLPRDVDRADLLALEYALVDTATFLIGLTWDPDEHDEHGFLGADALELGRAVDALSDLKRRIDVILPRLRAYLHQAPPAPDNSSDPSPTSGEQRRHADDHENNQP